MAHRSVLVIGDQIEERMAYFDEEFEIESEEQDCGCADPGEPADPDCEDCHGTGMQTIWFNPLGKWDWYSMPGRWTDVLLLRDGSRADRARAGDLDLSDDGVETMETTGILIGTDWYEQPWQPEGGGTGHMWLDRFADLLRSVPPDARVTVVDCHYFTGGAAGDARLAEHPEVAEHVRRHPGAGARRDFEKLNG